MNRLLTMFRNGLKPAFRRERVICRVLAAWCLFAAFVLMTGSSEETLFTSLSAFGADVSTALLLGGIALNFALLSVVAALLPALETDSWFLLLGATGLRCPVADRLQ